MANRTITGINVSVHSSTEPGRVKIELDSPATAEGAYGFRRKVTAVELGVDDMDGFLRQFRQDEA